MVRSMPGAAASEVGSGDVTPEPLPSFSDLGLIAFGGTVLQVQSWLPAPLVAFTGYSPAYGDLLSRLIDEI